MNRHTAREAVVRAENVNTPIVSGAVFTKLSTKEHMVIEYVTYDEAKETLVIYFVADIYTGIVCSCKIETITKGIEKGTHTLT